MIFHFISYKKFILNFFFLIYFRDESMGSGHMSRSLQQRVVCHLPSEPETRAHHLELGGQVDSRMGHVKTRVLESV